MSEVSCQSCEGACCRRSTLIVLNSEELATMEDNDAILLEVDPDSLGFALVAGEAAMSLAANPPPDKKPYMFFMDCPFLEEVPEGWAKCTIYDDPRRPGACANLAVGSEACLGAIETWQIIGMPSRRPET